MDYQIVSDMSGHMWYCNQAFMDITGYSAEELQQITWMSMGKSKLFCVSWSSSLSEFTLQCGLVIWSAPLPS